MTDPSRIRTETETVARMPFPGQHLPGCGCADMEIRNPGMPLKTGLCNCAAPLVTSIGRCGYCGGITPPTGDLSDRVMFAPISSAPLGDAGCTECGHPVGHHSIPAALAAKILAGEPVHPVNTCPSPACNCRNMGDWRPAPPESPISEPEMPDWLRELLEFVKQPPTSRPSTVAAYAAAAPPGVLVLDLWLLNYSHGQDLIDYAQRADIDVADAALELIRRALAEPPF